MAVCTRSEVPTEMAQQQRIPVENRTCCRGAARRNRYQLRLTILTHFAHSYKMGTVTKGFDARLDNRPFLVFDFWALWHSTLSARVQESQKLKTVG